MIINMDGVYSLTHVDCEISGKSSMDFASNIAEVAVCLSCGDMATIPRNIPLNTDIEIKENTGEIK